MTRKKLATMLVVAFAISATSVAPVYGAENEDISKYDCDYKPWLEMNAGVSNTLASAWASETTFEPYWTTTAVNVRSKPNTDSEIVTTLLWNQRVSVASFDNEWDLIYWNDKIYYINKNYLQDHEAEFELFEVLNIYFNIHLLILVSMVFAWLEIDIVWLLVRILGVRLVMSLI